MIASQARLGIQFVAPANCQSSVHCVHLEDLLVLGAPAPRTGLGGAAEAEHTCTAPPAPRDLPLSDGAW